MIRCKYHLLFHLFILHSISFETFHFHVCLVVSFIFFLILLFSIKKYSFTFSWQIMSIYSNIFRFFVSAKSDFSITGKYVLLNYRRRVVFHRNLYIYNLDRDWENFLSSGIWVIPLDHIRVVFAKVDIIRRNFQSSGNRSSYVWITYV